jgi:mono/diheme cytochrome c family protein
MSSRTARSRSRCWRRVAVPGAVGLLAVWTAMNAPVWASRDEYRGGALTAAASSDANARTNPVPADAESLGQGRALYEQQCAACHGMSGRGDGFGPSGIPDFTDSVRMRQRTDAMLYTNISEGRNQMPQFHEVLTEIQRWELVNYVRTFAARAKR